MNSVQHKVERAFEQLTAALHHGKSFHSPFIAQAHGLLESALTDMEGIPQPDEIVHLTANSAYLEKP